MIIKYTIIKSGTHAANAQMYNKYVNSNIEPVKHTKKYVVSSAPPILVLYMWYN